MLAGRCLCGDVRWRYDAAPSSATICNCHACRRYGAIWIYGKLGQEIAVEGQTKAFVRADTDGDLAFHCCARCGALQSWRPADPPAERGFRMAVNLRLSEPEAVAAIPLRRFDGLDAWADRESNGECVADFWA